MCVMKKNFLFLLIAAVAVAGCGANNAPVDDMEYVEYAEYPDCINCGAGNVVKYSMPNGNDLKLETAHHVIKIDAEPGKSYDYYVWTGEKTYANDPDIVIQDGAAAVLVSE